jgi:hypothetical protein
MLLSIQPYLVEITVQSILFSILQMNYYQFMQIIITEGYGTIDFSFNFRDYNNPTIASDDIAINYKVMDGTIDAIIKLISGTALSSLEVSGSLAGPRR